MRDGEAQSSAPNLARIIRWPHHLAGDSQLEIFMLLHVHCRSRSAIYRRILLSGFRFQKYFQSLRGFHSLMLTQVNADQRVVSKVCKTVMGLVV